MIHKPWMDFQNMQSEKNLTQKTIPYDSIYVKFYNTSKLISAIYNRNQIMVVSWNGGGD